MQRRLIFRGLLAGFVAGVVTFVFARIFAEPQIQAAIDYESVRDAAIDALRAAAGQTVDVAGPEVFSRTVQGWLGIGVGIVLLATVLGGMYAVAYAIAYGRVGSVGPRTLALLLAGAGFAAVYLVPSLKYPASPPSIGHEETIGPRSALYLGMVVASLLFGALAIWLARRLRSRFTLWTSSLLAGAAFVAAIGIVMGVLPQLGELSANVAAYGHQATETPLPLTNPAGTIVYPGFPADTLYLFRHYSVIAQVLLWGTIGLVFAPLADRLLTPLSGRAASTQSPQNTGSAASR